MRGCNTGGGEVILKDGGPLDFSFNNIKGEVDIRQVEPKGVGGEEEEKLLFL